MKTKIIEASDRDKFNWGKFMLGRFDDEWKTRARVGQLELDDDAPGEGPCLLRSQGWGPEHILIMDLSVGHAAIFLPRRAGAPRVDVENTGIYFCPLFRGFMEWVYQQDLADLDSLPDYVELEPVHLLRGPASGEYQGRKPC